MGTCVTHDAERDNRGFHDYVAARSPALLRTAYLLTGNQADAEDLLQAALAKTYLSWRRIKDFGSLDGYVRRAMVNTHISWWRRRRVEEYPTDDIPDQPVADHVGDSEMHDSLSRALRRLPERMRTAVVLRYCEDMSEAEIAGVLGVSLGTVKARSPGPSPSYGSTTSSSGTSACLSSRDRSPDRPLPWRSDV